VTGSNGHLGRCLIAQLRQSEPHVTIRALVRSERAADTLAQLPEAERPQESCIADYSDAAGLERAASDCEAIVHLVGIIKETATTTYQAAHDDSCRAIASAAAAAGVPHIIYQSLFGASSSSDNSCLASRGRAEEILEAAPASTTILRVPMVLGRGDDASRALANMSSGPLVFLMGGGATLQQPIDARDVIAAIAAALRSPATKDRVLNLGGPESLPHRELVLRAGAVTGGKPRIIGIPFGLVRGVAALMERVRSHPPFTRAFLGVLQHDDRVDAAEACKQLGIELTPLDETLRHCLSPTGDDANEAA
jgi:uncharacterized protein YbjT (DUF2867 family)